jgi:4-hydroxy-4-methyl-2-oxoglutarate aldolase
LFNVIVDETPIAKTTTRLSHGRRGGRAILRDDSMQEVTALLRQQVITKLYAAVLSDVLDSMGYMNQAMRPFIRPLDEEVVLFGKARTGIYCHVYHVEPNRNPYAQEIALIDDLQPGDVVVLACGGPTERVAPWGELLTTASQARKAVGCVTDGLVRDTKRIRKLRFPVFHGGIAPLDSKGRGEMVARDVPVDCGGAPVHPQDWIFGDADGVVVIPSSIAVDVLSVALRKINDEDATRNELLEGRSLSDVFERHGVL